MKSLFCLILFSLLSAVCYPQSDRSPNSRIRCQSVKLEPPLSADGTQIPVSQIRVRDERSDTSKFGLFYSSLDPELYKYCFADGAAQQFGRFVNEYLSPNIDSKSDQHILMCLRKLWITGNDKDDDTTINKFDLARHNVPDGPTTKVFFKSEFYLNAGGSYYALFRYDTTILIDGKPRLGTANLIGQILVAALERLKSVDYSSIPALKRKISQESLNEYYEQLYTARGMKNVKPSKGVYETFADFKQNRPSDTAYTIKFESLADFLYVKDKNGAEYVKRKVWGFSDGEKVFISHGNNFFRLHRQHNTWEFYGTDQLKDDFFGNMLAPSDRTTGRPVPYDKVKLGKLKFYQLDMETGEWIR